MSMSSRQVFDIHPVPHDPLFDVVRIDRFERSAICALSCGRCAAVLVDDFLAEETCHEVASALQEMPFVRYNPARVHPEVFRCGVGVSDYRVDGTLAPRYWEAVTEWLSIWQGLKLSYDPIDLCRERLAGHWPGGVGSAEVGGRELAHGVIREPNQGFLVHFDDAAREFAPGFPDHPLVAQFAFNLYLTLPKSGGQTVIWRRRWHPADENARLPGTYGYAESVVEDVESLTLTPQVGQAVLFDARNYHAVRPSSGGRRLAVGFQVGLTDAGRLLTWG